MADNITLKRIVDLVAQTDVDDTVYTIIDSVAGTVKKYPIGSLICSIAPIFDTTAAYAAGKYCNYNGQLYRFDEAHAAGSWTGSDATAVTLSEFLEAIGPDVDDLKEALTDVSATKADKDGSYEDLTAGNAKQLESTQYVEDSEPYLFRTSGGSSNIGNREYVDAIVGGSVVWNQLAKIDMVKSGTSAGLTFSADGDGYVTLTGTATDIFSVAFGTTVSDIVSGHVYYPVFGDIIEPGQAIMLMTNGWAQYFIPGHVKKSTADVESGSSVQVRISTGKTIDGKFPIMLFDLTQMFGSTIADYIYSLEQANAGAGVAWFKKLFPNMDAEYSYLEDPSDDTSWVTKKLRDYEAGFLFSVSGLASHDMVGFNQWDEEFLLGYYDANGAYVANNSYFSSKNAIKCFPNTVYRINQPESSFYLCEYDANGLFIKREQYSALTQSNVTTSSETAYLQFTLSGYGTTYKHDICINLSWSGTHNGEYQPYEKHSYPLDDSLILRGIPKLDAENNLYYDGDRYLPDGTVGRRFAQVDLGELNWSDTYVETYSVFTASLPSAAAHPSICICTKYAYSEYSVGSSRPDKTINAGVAYFSSVHLVVSVKDTGYSDAATFKTAMSGVKLVYEKETPTTETADPYQEVQICNDWGTEEYVLSDTAFPVPVGHETRYPANLRDKLQHLPDLADTDGYYAIKQVGTQMSLEPFRIPKAPTTPDGTYTLKATVSSGTVTYAWVDESQE